MDNFNLMENNSQLFMEEETEQEKAYKKLLEQADRENKLIIKNPDGSYSLEEIKLNEKSYENAVQNHIDSTAKLKGYDSSYTCLSYLNSTNNQWRNEAEIFLQWRDACWMKCHELLNNYKAGRITQPTIDQVINALPVIDW